MHPKSSRVDPRGMSTELLWGLWVAQGLFARVDAELIVTELWRDAERTYHASGDAADLRIKHLEDPFNQGSRIADELRKSLPRYFDVVFYEPGHRSSPNGHIHLEVDRRKLRGLS